MSGRPGWDAYYLSIARTVSARSNCSRRRVGAVIVVEKAIIATGYNGTPIGVRNCYEGGCPRCASDAPSGTAYDACICVHAEQNAIALAARHGNATQGGALYTTLRRASAAPRRRSRPASVRSCSRSRWAPGPTSKRSPSA